MSQIFIRVIRGSEIATKDHAHMEEGVETFLGLCVGNLAVMLVWTATVPASAPICSKCNQLITKESDMRHFIFTLQLQGKRFEDSISAPDRFTAERIMRDRYPGVVIWNVREE